MEPETRGAPTTCPRARGNTFVSGTATGAGRCTPRPLPAPPPQKEREGHRGQGSGARCSPSDHKVCLPCRHTCHGHTRVRKVRAPRPGTRRPVPRCTRELPGALVTLGPASSVGAARCHCGKCWSRSPVPEPEATCSLRTTPLLLPAPHPQPQTLHLLESQQRAQGPDFRLPLDKRRPRAGVRPPDLTRAGPAGQAPGAQEASH